MLLVAAAGAATLSIAADAAELRVGHSSLPRSLGMPLADTSHSGGFSFQMVFDRLTYTREAGRLEAGLHDAVQLDAVKSRVSGYAMVNYVVDWHNIDIRG
jgi:hypothetical protein